MKFLERIKSGLEWIEHGRTAWDLCVLGLASLGGAGFVRAWLLQHTRLSHSWITPIWLLVSAALLWLIGRLIPHLGRRSPTAAIQRRGDVGLVKTTIDLSVIEDLYKRVDYRLASEAEDEIGKAIANITRDEREKTLVRLLIAALWAATFAEIWQFIYRSQVRALIQLNGGAVTRTTLQVFYTNAVAQYPGIYAAYSYENWLGFLRNNVLITEKDGFVHITVRGQAFLQYMTQLGRSFDDRAY